MLEILESAKAKNGKNYGADRVGIKYPAVSSCLTLTLVYKTIMVGAHWAVSDKKGAVTKATINETLTCMQGLGVKEGGLQRALLIGAHQFWRTNNPNAYDTLLKWCMDKDDKLADVAADCDTSSVENADIEVARGPMGKGGVKIVDKKKGVVVKTFSFESK